MDICCLNCQDKIETMGIESDINFYFSDTFKKLTVNELTKFEILIDEKIMMSSFLTQ